MQLSKPSALDFDQELALPQDYSAPPEFRPDVPPVDFEEATGVREALNYAAAGERRWKEQKHFMGKQNEAMRKVNFLHPYEVFRKLQKAGVDARIEAPCVFAWRPDDSTGVPVMVRRAQSYGRIWLHDDAICGRVGVSAWVTENGKRIAKMITTFQYPYGPEWSLLRFDCFDVPQEERFRGWRTALLALILADVITEEEVNRAFGPVALGPVSLLYRERLYYHRQRKAGLVA